VFSPNPSPAISFLLHATALITLIDAHLAYGDLPLLDEANISIEPGERVGLIGRNGTGKSSLLSVLAGKTMLDDGQLQRMDGLTIHYVEQEPQLPDAPTLKESLILRGKLDETTDEREKWRILAKLDENLSHFELNPNADPKLTSGGEKKRAALALAFTLAPQLLLLDEPTNHLDMRAIRLLEARSQDELKNQRSLVVITHDRAFLDKVATRIVELDRGVLRSYPGNFAAYETRKEEELAAEELERRRFDKFWAQEEVWIRKGIEARRTRNEGRVKRLEQLRRERAARRDQMGSIRMSIDAGEKSGKIVAEVKGLSKSFGDCVIVKDLDFTLMRGDRLGLIGRNGAGKSTLIKLLLGKIQPDAGTVKLGTNIKLAYFDQLREQLDLTKTVAETISPGSDWVEIGGERKHIIAYLGDFLFPPRRANVPVSSLSGGERNRLLLARLFALPANLLVLDEPTNDLDIDSLELLEQTLAVYPGTIILVSHDRRFLDNVVTEVLAPEGDGKWREYVGGYTEWFTQRQQENDPFAAAKTEKKAEKPAKNEKPRDVIPQKIKLSWREARELEALPEKLEAMEKKQASKRRKTLEHELEWINMAPKARQAKGKARLKSYETLLNEDQKERETKLEIFIPNGPRLGNKVIEAQHVAKAFGSKLLFDDLNFTLPPNGIVGVIGPNGAGKTTLFKMILGMESIDKGTFEVGQTVRIGYADQTHKDIDPKKTVYQVISGGQESIRVGGREINARAYLSRFNFSGADQEKQCGVLSGGERNRLHLALTLKADANVLLLDEPTNDIDVNTLRALEEGLENFAGCAVVVSHDRWFLDRICTHILSFEGDSNVVFYEGSYSEYEEHKRAQLGDIQPKRVRYRKLIAD